MKTTPEKNTKKALILSYPVDLITMEDAVQYAEDLIKSSNGGHVVTINPEMIMQASNSSQLDSAIKQADLTIPDGVGIIISLKKLGINDVKQVPGIEFSYNLILKCVEKGYKVGFIGASKEVIDAMTQIFRAKYPAINIVFTQDGYFDDSKESDIIAEIKTTKPDVLFVALGVPKQELWISKYRKELSSTLMVGVGGSFDVWANKVKRAPVIFRKVGCEWLFRLISQPSRFNRIFPRIPLFFIKVLLDNENTRKEY